MAKTITLPELKLAATQANDIRKNARLLWENGMKQWKLESPEYKTICKVGRSAQKLLLKLHDQLLDHGISSREIREKFMPEIEMGCGFN